MILDKYISAHMLDELLVKAKQSPRLRTHKEIHDRGAESPIQWFLNVIVPGSYVSPHVHPENDKWEWFQIVRGTVAVLLFDSNGVVIDRKDLSTNDVCGVEIPPRSWHTIVALEDSVLLELKSGPYDSKHDKIFAEWAPKEGDPAAEKCEEWYRSATVGDLFRT